MLKVDSYPVGNFIRKYGFYFACIVCSVLGTIAFWYSSYLITVAFCAVILLISLFCDVNKIIILSSLSILFSRFLEHNYGAIILLVALGIKCLQGIVSGKIKFKKVYIVPIVILAYFLLVPFMFGGINVLIGKNNALVVIMLAIGFEIFLLRDKIDVCYIVRWIAGLYIATCCFAVIFHFLDAEASVFRNDGIGTFRYRGLMRQENSIAMWSSFICFFYLSLYLLKRVGRVEFYIVCVISIIFGLLAQSKAFLLFLSLFLIVYLVYECKSSKKHGFLQVGTVFLVTGVACLIFKDNLSHLFVRFFGHRPNFDLLYNITTGRSWIWSQALGMWSNNIFSIFFGVGDSFQKIIHNGYLDMLVRYGLIGALLLPIYVSYLMALARENIRISFVRFLPFLVLFAYMMIEVFSNGNVLLLLLSLLFFFNFNEEIITSEKVENISNNDGENKDIQDIIRDSKIKIEVKEVFKERTNGS